MTKWQELIKRHADGKPICNCGDGYYSLSGHGICYGKNGQPIERFDLPICVGGCSTNQIVAKEYIATKVLEESVIEALCRIVDQRLPFGRESLGVFMCRYCHRVLEDSHAGDCPIMVIRNFLMAIDNKRVTGTG